MRGSGLFVLMVTLTCTLYGGQPEQKDQKIVSKKAVGVLGRTEQVLYMTSRLVFRTFGFARNYPRLTFVIVTVTPMAFPRYRSYVQRQSLRMVSFATRKIGQWLRQSLQGWLLTPLSDRLELAQQGLEEQHELLQGHTSQLSDLQDTVGYVYEDTQGLLKGHEASEERALRMHKILSEHSKKLDAMLEQQSTMHGQAKATHAKVEGLEGVARAQVDQLAAIADRQGATSAQVQKVTVSIDELYAQLVKLDGRVAEGTTETIDKIGLLKEHFGGLSEEQKRLFEDYGAQFALRFDQLSENLRVVLAAMAAPQALPCGQQQLRSIK